MHGLVVAHQFIASGGFNHVLVADPELISRCTDWKDRGTYILFADGAGAVVIQHPSPFDGVG